MLLLGLEDRLEEFTADEVAGLLAVSDRRLQHRMRGALELQIAGERFRHALADQQLDQILQVGQAVEEEDAFHQLVGVLHLVDRLVVLVLAELLEAPVPEHARMQEILVDRRQLVGEHRIQVPQDFPITLHRLVSGSNCASRASWTALRGRATAGRKLDRELAGVVVACAGVGEVGGQ